jgi:hypothetical protein
MDNIGRGLGEALMGAFLALGFVCFVAGAGLVWLSPKVWEWIKPILHAWTS